MYSFALCTPSHSPHTPPQASRIADLEVLNERLQMQVAQLRAEKQALQAELGRLGRVSAEVSRGEALIRTSAEVRSWCRRGGGGGG